CLTRLNTFPSLRSRRKQSSRSERQPVRRLNPCPPQKYVNVTTYLPLSAPRPGLYTRVLISINDRKEFSMKKLKYLGFAVVLGVVSLLGAGSFNQTFAQGNTPQDFVAPK